MFGPHDLFVAPYGNNAWSGRLPEPNAEGSDGPLATIVEARERIRDMKQPGRRTARPSITGGVPGPLTVWLRGGVYPLTQPVIFTAEDSAPVTYAAYPGETPILDGGERISGWRVEQVNGQTAWVVELPEVATGKWHFRQLFVNGRRATRPRLPKTNLYRMEDVPGLPRPASWGEGGYTRFVAAEGDVQPFANLTDVEVVYVHFWIEERSPLAALDPTTRSVTMARPSHTALVGSFGSQLADYYFDNVFEALTDPGEWYLDRTNGQLIYLPLPGEDPETAEVYAPRCLQLIGVVGNPDERQYVEFLRFRGLTFRHTDWRHPDVSDGATFIAIPGGAIPESRRHGRADKAAVDQAACDVPGVVYFEAARHCGLEDCVIEHIGWYGVEIADACTGLRVMGNTIRDLGAGGVKINGAAARGPEHRRTGNHRITDNIITAGGRIFHSAVGVLSMNAFQVAICHNHIYDLFYSGISCGWVWGYTDNVSHDNLIEKNHIHHLGQGLLSDMGGIYMLGVQPGTVLRGNLIYDVVKAHYGAWCIYPDEGSSHLLIEQNICYDTNGEAFHQHYGRENIVRNNIFAFGGESQIAHGRADAEHHAFTMERNIIITDGTPLFSSAYNSRLADRNPLFFANLYFDIAGRPVTFHDRNGGITLSLKEWQALGQDHFTLVADPRCKDIAARDFTLAPDSPAFAMGFEPFDLSDVGPRPNDARE